MFSFDNTHIFTGYLKQLLGSTYLPDCKIYTKEFADYFETHGYEDPRVVESFDTLSEQRLASRTTYLKNNSLVNYFWQPNSTKNFPSWKHMSKKLYVEGEPIYGLTKTLKSHSNFYDRKTHEYLGDYLRFIRDYYNIDLMSMYNCFSNRIVNNLYFKADATTTNTIEENGNIKSQAFPALEFSSYDSRYRIYAVPVKLFANYTIAIDSYQGVELFCGFYNTKLDGSKRGTDLIRRSYRKLNKTSFNRPFLYNGLDVQFWNYYKDTALVRVPGKETPQKAFLTDSIATRWDILARESDLKLFIKVPSSCDSSITILEGNYISYNDFSYKPQAVKKAENSHSAVTWSFEQNKWITNFQEDLSRNIIEKINPKTQQIERTITEQIIPNLNDRPFKPINRLQLLAYNTKESYPFADRLVEYLVGSVITPEDEIPDNIKRAQKVMTQNGYFFSIPGLWEPKMQKIAYDYVMNTGPITISNRELVDQGRGKHPKLGHNAKYNLFDLLGYIDKDVEKWYASWKLTPIRPNSSTLTTTTVDTIQNVDIYDGLYDI